MRIDSEVLSKLTIGRKFKTDFFFDEKEIIRTITVIKVNQDCSSGYMLWADGGEPCECCGRRPGRPIDGIDANWIKELA